MTLEWINAGLIYLDGAAWIGFGISVVLGLIPGLPDLSLLRWLMAGLAFGAGIALIVFYRLSTRSRLAYWLLVGLLGMIALLSLTDQLGFLDWVSFFVNLAALTTLLLKDSLGKRNLTHKKGSSSK